MARDGCVRKGVVGKVTKFCCIGMMRSKVFRYGTGNTFQGSKVGPLINSSTIVRILSRGRVAKGVARVLPHGGRLVHPTMTGVSRTLIIFTIAGPGPRCGLLSHFLIVVRQGRVPIMLYFGGASVTDRPRVTRLGRICAKYKCPIVFADTGRRRGVDRLGSLLGKGAASVTNPSNIKGSSLVGLLRDRIGVRAKDVDGGVSQKGRAAERSRLVIVKRRSCVVSAPKFDSLCIGSFRGRSLGCCFPRFAPFRKRYGFGNYSRVRRPKYTIGRTMRRKGVRGVECRSCARVCHRLGREGECWICRGCFDAVRPLDEFRSFEETIRVGEEDEHEMCSF